MKFCIAICDDEEMMLKINQVYITEMIKKIGVEAQITCFKSGQEVIKFAQNHDIDIAFLDIDMKGLSGIATAVQLKKLKQSIITIFVTGHREFAVEAFDAEAVGYLVKPVEPQKLEKLLKRAINLVIMQKNRLINSNITITEDNLKKKIQQYKIIYIEKKINKCLINTTEQTHSCYDTIANMKNMLDDSFLQISQGVIVNKRYIRSIEGNDVLLKNQLIFSIGRKFIKEVKASYF